MTTQPRLSAERARELFSYDPETGELRWRVSKGRRGREGAPVLGLSVYGYRRVSVGRVRYMAHRVVWLMATGKWPEEMLDHINGVRADNRLANLREANRSINNQNVRCSRRNSLTGFLGVSHNGGGFMARIRVSGLEKHLGTYETAKGAHEAYLTAKRELHAGCTI